MRQINRRYFVGNSLLSMAGALTAFQIPEWLRAESAPSYIDIPLGFQSFPIRDLLSKDFAGTLKTMAGMGYKMVEMCSPKGYAGIGFGAFVNMKTADIRSIIADSGLTCPSCHFGFSELKDNLDERIEFAHELGIGQMICSTFWLPPKSTLQDYQDHALQLNAIAGKIKKAGLKTGFHNHEMEFAMLEGQLIYDVLMKSFDPSLVKMQFQTEVINLGYRAADYFTKYPGRFISSHLSDWTTDKKEAALGQGMIDWKGFFAAAKTGGVENFFVEMNFDKFKDSASYIRTV